MQNSSWKNHWSEKQFRITLLIYLLFTALTLVVHFQVLEYAENRKGVYIEKGWLDDIIPPVDFSILIFILIYSFSIFGLVYYFRQPDKFILLIGSFAILQLFRSMTLLLVPLQASEKIIPLEDPLLQMSFYNGCANLNDLFFSGHTATLFLFALLTDRKLTKLIFVLVSTIVGILLIIQRVHYISDVLAAFIFTWVAVGLAKTITTKILKNRS
jgi:membrane-associated phospholipid phosphatase